MILRPAMKVQLAHAGSVYDVVPMLQQLATETVDISTSCSLGWLRRGR